MFIYLFLFGNLIEPFEMIIKYKNKKINVRVKRASSLGKFTGLMFKSKNTENLLFDFKNDIKMAIHSYFVFFPFLAVWVNDKNEVLEWKVVEPFISIVKPKKPFRKLVEVPFNSANLGIIDFFVGKRKV